MRRASGLATPPGRTSASNVSWSASATTSSTAKVSALSRWSNACTSPASVLSSTGDSPASSTACHGSVSSTCSIALGGDQEGHAPGAHAAAEEDGGRGLQPCHARGLGGLGRGPEQALLQPVHAQHEAQGGEGDEHEQGQKHECLRSWWGAAAGGRPAGVVAERPVPLLTQGQTPSHEREGAHEPGEAGGLHSRCPSANNGGWHSHAGSDRRQGARTGPGPVVEASGRRDVTVSPWPSVAGDARSTPPTVCGGTSTRWPRSSLSTKKPGAVSSGA